MDRWILAGACGVVFLFFAGVNAIYLWMNVSSRGEGGPSLGPIFGGLFGALGVMILPVGDLPHRLPYGLIPLIADVGCLPYLLYALWYEWRR